MKKMMMFLAMVLIMVKSYAGLPEINSVKQSVNEKLIQMFQEISIDEESVDVLIKVSVIDGEVQVIDVKTSNLQLKKELLKKKCKCTVCSCSNCACTGSYVFTYNYRLLQKTEIFSVY